MTDITRIIEQHKRMIDSTQEVALELTNLEGITQKIIDHEASTTRTIADAQSGLRTGDVNKIKGHAGQLQAVTRSLTAMLPR